MLAKQSQSNIKQNNLHLILSTVIQHEPVSRADLVRLTHISKPTVSNLIDELIQKNLVFEVGEGRSRIGRKPILIKFNSTRKYFLVFNTGREDYHVALSNLKGEILEEQSGTFGYSQTYQERLSLLHTSMQSLLDKQHVSSSALLKIHGVAPGVYVEKDKALKWSGTIIPEDHDMQTFLEETFQTPVLLNHSSKLALLGEKIAGKARDASHAVYIDFGYGLGCSFMFDNSIYFGANDSAGELGFIYPDLKEFALYKLLPYKYGALEDIISGKALQEKGKEIASRYKDSRMREFVGDDLNKITAKVIFDAAKQHDLHAYSLLKESFRYLNMALCNIINMLNPELIIFGGGISKAGDFLLSFIVHEIQDKVFIMPEFAISELKDQASIIGAIAYLIEHTDFLTEL